MEGQKPRQYSVEDDVETTTASSTKEDDGYGIYQRYRNSEFSPEETARVLRKIDFRLVPLLFAIYLIQYLDKNSLNFASVYGLKTGTKLEGQDYSWLGEHSLPISLPFLWWGHCSCFFSLRIDILFWIPRGTISVRLCAAEIAHGEDSEYHDIGYGSIQTLTKTPFLTTSLIYSMGRTPHDDASVS